MTILLLTVIALTLLWGIVVREPLTTWLAARAQRRRVLEGMAGAAPPSIAARVPVDASVTLLLDGEQGPEHEITMHGTDEAPATYQYAGKQYQRTGQAVDGAWHYARLLLVLLALAWATPLAAQGTGVTLRSSGGTELGTSGAPVRTDTTGTTTQPVSAATLPLPANAAQETGGNLATTVATLGATTDAAAGDATGSVNAHIRQIAKLFANVTFGDVNNVASATGLLNTIPVGRYDATQPTLTTGRWNALQLSSRGELFIAKGVSGLSIDNTTFAATQSGTWTVQPGNTANTTAWKVDGSAVTQPVSLAANQSVNVAQINGATPLMGAGNTGTGSSRVTIATDQAALAAAGQGATGAAVPSGAQYLGTLAQTALPTAATAGNLTGALADKFGRQVVIPTTVRDLVGTQTTTLSASTAETTIVTAGAAGVFNDLVMLIISNTSAATNTRIDFRDTTAGTVLFSLYSVGGAAPVGFALPVPIPQTSTATNWTAQCATSTTDVRIYAVFAKNK